MELKRTFDLVGVDMERWKWEAVADGVARRLEDMLPGLGYDPITTPLYRVADELKDRDDLTREQREFRALHEAAVTLESHLHG